MRALSRNPKIREYCRICDPRIQKTFSSMPRAHFLRLIFHRKINYLSTTTKLEHVSWNWRSNSSYKIQLVNRTFINDSLLANLIHRAKGVRSRFGFARGPQEQVGIEPQNKMYAEGKNIPTVLAILTTHLAFSTVCIPDRLAGWAEELYPLQTFSLR